MIKKEVFIVYKTFGPKDLYYIGVHKTFTINDILIKDGYIGCGVHSILNKSINRLYKAVKIEDINKVPELLKLPKDYLVNKPCGAPTHKKTY